MNYKNGELILPAELLNILQNYAEGEMIYIPKRDRNRKSWGETSGTRNLLEDRNHEIFKQYEAGASCALLAEKYYLSEDSIRKILRRMKVKDHAV